MKYYKRESYLQKIRGFYHDCELIKVLTGVRRCGKSCLMRTIADEIIESGVPTENIIYIELDKRGYKSIETPEQLENLIDSKSVSDGTKYIFIDEIQNVKGFETMINAFREEGEYSIFITGSNSYLLSGELVTKLTGRYLEFEIFTLTFDEYIGMKRFLGKPLQGMLEEFDAYISEGGYPKALQYDSPDDKRMYVSGVTAEIFQKDIRQRIKIRRASVFEKVQRFIINNFGAPTSLTSLLKALKQDGTEIKRETLNRYIKILVDAKILYECDRFDLKSRKSIAGEKKYYLSDIGFYYATNTDNRINYGPVLENITYIYARSKGYAVSVGRIGRFECDFILRKGVADYRYLQVCLTIQQSITTEDREYRPLESIADNYPKYVLTRNDLLQHRNGIIHKNLPELMCNGDLF